MSKECSLRFFSFSSRFLCTLSKTKFLFAESGVTNWTLLTRPRRLPLAQLKKEELSIER